MKLHFKTRQLQKICNESDHTLKKIGQAMAKKLHQRLMELKAAETLADISHLPPPRLHELTGRDKGKFTVDLHGKNRLYFVPAADEVPELESGGKDLSKIQEIIIIKIDDPHGKRKKVKR